MFYNQLINIQRKVRAFLSFPYNKNEILNKKDNLLIDELSLKAKKLVNNKRKIIKKLIKFLAKKL